MADNEVVVNGGDRALGDEIFVDSEEADPQILKLMQKIEVLEQEKSELIHENGVVKERITKLKGELEELEREKAELKVKIEHSEADKKALESIAVRAAELEMDLSRLQHDLITAESSVEEANKEAHELKRELGKLKESDSLRGEKVDVLEKERVLLLQKIENVEKELEEEKKVGEERVRGLVNKLEGKEGAEKAEIDGKESEIYVLKKKVEDLNAVIVKNGMEMEKLKNEKGELESAKNGLEGLLKKYEERGKEVEEKMGLLCKDVESLTSGSKDKALDGINGIPIGYAGRKRLELTWPVYAATTGVVIALGTMCYIHTKQR